MIKKALIAVGAAAVIISTAGPASARPVLDEQNPGGGTVGLDCVYDVNTGGETCAARYVPDHVVEQSWHWRNPLPVLWDDLRSLF